VTDVVGVDPSLTGTGIAGVSAFGLCWSITVASKGHTADTLIERDIRLTDITDRVTAHAKGARLVVIEGPAISRSEGSVWDRAGLWWRIVHRLHGAEIPVAVCTPSTRAKWATGKGRADKAAVAAVVARLWPSAALDDDNQADALAFATIGLQWLDPDHPRLARHTTALGAVQWPPYPEPKAAA
jgi:crossover junction endodeoxyribonuclease RuvC